MMRHLWMVSSGIGYVLADEELTYSLHILTKQKQKRWIFIFQYPIVSLGVAVATDITQAAGIYCESSNKPYFAHLWVWLFLHTLLIIKLD